MVTEFPSMNRSYHYLLDIYKDTIPLWLRFYEKVIRISDVFLAVLYSKLHPFKMTFSRLEVGFCTLTELVLIQIACDLFCM